eukprot:37010-Eustigmatos_ZCMA.PRE.1
MYAVCMVGRPADGGGRGNGCVWGDRKGQETCAHDPCGRSREYVPTAEADGVSLIVCLKRHTLPLVNAVHAIPTTTTLLRSM